MKISVQYLNDSKGNIQAVQLPATDWGKIMLRIKKYEQMLKIKTDLQEAFSDVEKMRKGLIKKQTLSEFLDEL